MKATKLRRLVYRAMQLPNPDEPEPEHLGCIEVGAFQPADSPAAVADIAGRIAKLIQVLYTVFPPEEVARFDFLTFPDYLQAVTRVDQLRERFNFKETTRHRELVEARRDGLLTRRDAVERIEDARHQAHRVTMERQRQAEAYRREQLDIMAAHGDRKTEEQRQREAWREEQRRQRDDANKQHSRQLAQANAEHRERLALWNERERADAHRHATGNAVARLEDQRQALENDGAAVADSIAWVERERRYIGHDQAEQQLDRLYEKARTINQKRHLLTQELERAEETHARGLPVRLHPRQFEIPQIAAPEFQAVPRPDRSPGGDVYRALLEIMPEHIEPPHIDTTPATIAQIDGEIDILNRQLAHIDDDLTIPPHEKKKQRFLALYSPDYFRADGEGYLAYLQAVCAETGFPLAAFFYLWLPYLLPERERQKHTYIIGQTGSGKSELLKALIHTDTRRPLDPAAPCVVVIDPKGDFADQVAAWPEAAESGRLIYVRPDIGRNLIPTINPFELADKSPHAAELAAEQFAAVFEELLRRDGAKLTMHMRTLLVPCLTVLLRLQNTSLETLKTFMDDSRNQKLIECGMHAANPAHRQFFEHEFKNTAYKPTKEALLVRLQRILNSNILRRMLVGHSTIDLEKATRERKIIIFSLPKGDVGVDTTPTFGVFLVAMLQAIVIRRRPHERVPCHLFIDECQNFLTPSINTILNESGRSFKLSLTLAQQYFGQGMDAELASAIAQNTAIHMVGKSNSDMLKKAAVALGIPQEDVRHPLTTGVFLSHTTYNNRTTRIRIPSTLVDRNYCIKPKRWGEVLAQQHADYYRPITGGDDHAPIITPEGDAPTTSRPVPDLEFE